MKTFEQKLFFALRPKARRSKARRGRVIDSARLDWQAMQPCCITGIWPATTHHVRFCGSPKDDTRTIRLIQSLHQLTHAEPGIPCIEQGKEKFEEFHGISIEAEIRKSQAAFERETGKVAA